MSFFPLLRRINVERLIIDKYVKTHRGKILENSLTRCKVYTFLWVKTLHLANKFPSIFLSVYAVCLIYRLCIRIDSKNPELWNIKISLPRHRRTTQITGKHFIIIIIITINRNPLELALGENGRKVHLNSAFAM